MRTPVARRVVFCALLLGAPLPARAASVDEGVWRHDAVAFERPTPALSADAALGLEPIPDAATPGATATSAAVTAALPVAPVFSFAAELVQLQGDAPALGASVLLGAAIARRLGAAELSLLLARPVDPARPTFEPPAAVLELGAALEHPLSPTFALRRTSGPGASTECNGGLSTTVSAGLEVGLAGRTVVSGGALDAGALVVLALR